MAMFFSFPVQAPSSYTPIIAKWHPSHPALAVSAKETRHGTESGVVHVFTDDGEYIDDSTIQRSSLPTVLQWNTMQRFLVVGWENGEVMLWNEATHALHEGKSLHEDSVCCVEWNSSGTRLVTGDAQGRVGVWKAAKNGKLTLLQEFKRSGRITNCVFLPDESDGDMNNTQSIAFYVASDDGSIYFCDGTGRSEVSATTETAVQEMLYNPDSDTLVLITADLMMTQYHVEPDHQLEDKREARLSGRLPNCAIWAGNGVLVTTTGENMVRVWDLDHEENYTLSIARESGQFPIGDPLLSCSYDPRTRMLAACSQNGMVYMWQFKGGKGTMAHNLEGAERWAFKGPPAEVSSGSLSHISWGGGRGLMTVVGEETVDILREQIMRKSFGNLTAAVQVSAGRIVAEGYGKGFQDIDTELTIKGLACKGEYIAAWGGKSVATYEMVKKFSIARPAGTFKCEVSDAAIHDQTVFTAEGARIHARNMQGASKQVLSMNETEGLVVSLECQGDFLVCATSAGYIRVWDLSKREARQHGVAKLVKGSVDSITSVNINANGSRVSFVGTVDGSPDTSVWIWDTEADAIHSFDFGSLGLMPVSHFWDGREPRLLACEASAPSKEPESGCNVVTFFATPADGLLMQRNTAVPAEKGPLIGIEAPRMFFAKRPGSDQTAGKVLGADTMADFAGLEDANTETANAMMDFSYFVTTGNMDEAFKAVRTIKSENVWENMARMCVSNKRLDVATVCLGNMGNAVAARALRECGNEKQVEVRVAALAIQLGMYDEAKKLYEDCGRQDLINRLQQDQGKWEEAIATAKKTDRVHLRNTYYLYARHQEAMGKYLEAAKNYELSDTHRFEVPRMLFDDPTALENFIKRSQDKKLLKWWAQYLESSSEMEQALEYYKLVGDSLSLVRVHCYCDDIEKARELVDSSKDKAAAYHLAREYENVNNVEAAIKYFSMSECYSNAIRLSKENGMKEQVLALALKSSKTDMIEAAEFYESQGIFDKAVTLYHKGGRVSKALDLCFQHSLYQPLSTMSGDLDQDTDPELLQRAADFFTQNRQHDKAVNLLISSGQHEAAIDMCMNHNVVVTDEMAEDLTLPKSDDVDPKFRKKLLEKLADCCALQGSYQLATKKYTQSGNKLKAMRSLLKSGDTEQIIFYASRCRQKEIYVMAANYLQSLDWRRDNDIMKHIINFYTKGKALDSLSSFYDACAQVEIDDYQNYNKALSALNEALKYMSKAKMKNFEEQEARVSSLQQRILLIKKFCEVRKLKAENPEEMMRQAKILLAEPDIETAVRVGDVYGLMIEHIASSENYQETYALMQEMREKIPNVNIAYYVNQSIIEQTHRALNIPLGRGRGAEDDDGDEIEEEVPV